MRWDFKTKYTPDEFSKRTVRKFIIIPTLLPVLMGDYYKYEYRWLEWATVEQTYYVFPDEGWVDRHWINND